jgi:hypothetical protein
MLVTIVCTLKAWQPIAVMLATVTAGGRTTGELPDSQHRSPFRQDKNAHAHACIVVPSLPLNRPISPSRSHAHRYRDACTPTMTVVPTPPMEV